MVTRRKKKLDRWCRDCFADYGEVCKETCECGSCKKDPARQLALLRKRVHDAIRGMIRRAVSHYDQVAKYAARDSDWDRRQAMEYDWRAWDVLWNAQCVAEATKTLDEHSDLVFFKEWFEWQWARDKEERDKKRCETETTSS